jgi:hypothetical protein
MSEALASGTAMLLHGAGLRVEEIVIAAARDRDVDPVIRLGEFDAFLVCTPPGEQPAPLPAIAVRLARRDGLPVLDGGTRREAVAATR